MNHKLVLAFSGGLDTSFCAKYLAEQGYEVHTAIVDTGGFDQDELENIRDRALKMGSKSHVCLDMTKRYYEECVRYLIFGNVLKNQTYPLSVSAERAFQAMAIAEYSKNIGATHIAHGSTGAGNDQVRFDLIFRILCPEIEIVTPIRDLKLSREEEVEYLQKNGVEGNWEKAAYSINKGLWGTSVGGKETLTSNQYLPEDAFPTQLTKTGEEKIEIGFEEGEPVSVNGEYFRNPVLLIKHLQEIAGPWAVGRDIHVGDTIIGIKGRVGFEAAAPMLLLKSHHALEKHVLGKSQLYWKDILSNAYGTMLHEGQFLDPLMRNIEAFLKDTQPNVTGKVKIHLAPYRFYVVGVESPFDMMSSQFGKYGEMNNAWSGEDVKGFAKILSLSSMIHQKVNADAK